MKRTFHLKFFAFLVISLFIVSYFPQVETTTSAAQSINNWVATPMHISRLSDPSASPQGYYPSQIKTAYGLPPLGGAGSTIAIIDSFDTPSVNSDLTFFSTQFSLPLPTNSNFEVVKMSPNIDVANSSWMLETCLDVEWAHSIAPDAKILLVEAKSSSDIDLLQAVGYAGNRPDVVAVSMSWGGNEESSMKSFDSYFNSNYGAVFFASSGDKGAEVNWPASSPNVVAVGGTTLNLHLDGTVISETAWSGSGGGISAYETMPAYQMGYGLNTILNVTKRSVPDVSYDANPSTGVSVYCNSQWYVVGGTSAGAPQWAAIYALGHSATNVNLYQKAKLAYSSYFRDITSGSNGAFAASLGYDCVTGLGSPLTVNFGLELTVSPTSGPANFPITLNGVGFKVNSFVNISYLNPGTSVWIPIVNNLPISSTQNFTYSVNAPDLLRSNFANDSQPVFDNIVFRAQGNSNSNSCNTTIPYAEWRRGLTQVSNIAATGIYGNNTDLTTNVFVQNNQSIAIAGEWFNPGNVSLLWDGKTNLGNASTDATGLFNTIIVVPTTFAGRHRLTINDEVSSFSVNMTRLPTIANDYTGGWHTADATINLTPDFKVNETFYRINNGPISNVTASGQPVITTEGSENILEYWSTWDVYGTGIMELPHVILAGIQLQKTSPAGSIQINDDATLTALSTVTLTISATDSLSGLNLIRFSNDGNWDQIPWENYTNIKNWQLAGGDGLKTVYCQIEDNAGLVTSLSSSITLIPPQPLQISPSGNSSPFATQSPSAPSPSPTLVPSSNSTATPSSGNSPSPLSSAAPVVPEFSVQMFLVLLALATFSIGVAYKRKHK